MTEGDSKDQRVEGIVEALKDAFIELPSKNAIDRNVEFMKNALVGSRANASATIADFVTKAKLPRLRRYQNSTARESDPFGIDVATTSISSEPSTKTKETEDKDPGPSGVRAQNDLASGEESGVVLGDEKKDRQRLGLILSLAGVAVLCIALGNVGWILASNGTPQKNRVSATTVHKKSDSVGHKPGHKKVVKSKSTSKKKANRSSTTVSSTTSPKSTASPSSSTSQVSSTTTQPKTSTTNRAHGSTAPTTTQSPKPDLGCNGKEAISPTSVSYTNGDTGLLVTAFTNEDTGTSVMTASVAAWTSRAGTATGGSFSLSYLGSDEYQGTFTAGTEIPNGTVVTMSICQGAATTSTQT